MSDFTSSFWSLFITVLTLVGILACAWLLRVTGRRQAATGGAPQVTGHTWDTDLQELNNPLPRWWMWLFYLTIGFGLVYLAAYPGLGSFPGALGWSSRGQYDAEKATIDAQVKPLFDRYAQMDLKALAKDPDARDLGQRLFLNNCAQCHGADAGGSRGFPNLRDNDWLYGGEPETIQTTITEGRQGIMPALAGALGEAGTRQVANYVLSLSNSPHDAGLAAAGKTTFETICAACHGATGTGNQQLGAPNLTDKIWLYGGGEKGIVATLTEGRSGKMPAHKDILSPAKIHLLAAYVYGLSH